MALRAKCPICGDDAVYSLWGSEEPPAGCPLDAAEVTACEFQMAKAAQAALFRKAAPDAFDETGAMLPGQLARVLEAAYQIKPNHELILGGGIPETMLRRAGKL